MNDYCMTLRVWHYGKKDSPDLLCELGGKSKNEIADTLIALGVLFREQSLPQRDSKGRFITKKERE